MILDGVRVLVADRDGHPSGMAIAILLAQCAACRCSRNVTRARAPTEVIEWQLAAVPLGCKHVVFFLVWLSTHVDDEPSHASFSLE